MTTGSIDAAPAPAPALSVILPCYAGAAEARQTVAVLVDYLPKVSSSWEIVVVDDGGNDFDAVPLSASPQIRLVRHPANRGKGAAVRTGMLAARGGVRIYTDVDMPYDRELLPFMADCVLRRGFHLVIGDRTLADSSYAEATGWFRRRLSALGSLVIGSLVTGGFFDTQCGIKAMSGEIADAVFPLVRTRGFAFDVEVVYVALKHGLDIKRVPVRLRRNLRSTVRPIRDSIVSAVDILRIKLRQMRGQYRNDQLDAILRGERARAYAPFLPD